MKKNIVKILLIISLLILVFAYLVYRFFFSMSALPEGEFLYSVDSPNGEYTINAYIARGNATVAESIRAELVYNNRNKSPKNIYWQYRELTADIIWIDDTTVEINGIRLDVTKDIYDFRREREKVN